MSATHATQSTVPQGPVLYMAIELSLATWKLAFTVGSGQKPRIRSVPAGISRASWTRSGWPKSDSAFPKIPP